MSIFLLSNQIFYYRFLGFCESQSSNFLYTLRVAKPNILWERKPRCWNLFLPSFSISHSSVIHREVCVKDFSGTTAPRILKFGINVGFVLLYCVKENQHATAYHSFYLPICLSLQWKFSSQNSQLLLQPESSNFVYTLRGTKYIVRKKTKILWLIFAFFFHVSFFPSLTPMWYIGKFVSKISQELLHLGFLKFGSNIGYDMLYCVKENQPAAAYHCFICPFFFLSKQIFYYKFLSLYESQSLQILYTHWEWPSILWDRKQNWDLFCLLSPFFHLSLQCNT